jgi:hypothetical protein
VRHWSPELGPPLGETQDSWAALGDDRLGWEAPPGLGAALGAVLGDTSVHHQTLGTARRSTGCQTRPKSTARRRAGTAAWGAAQAHWEMQLGTGATHWARRSGMGPALGEALGTALGEALSLGDELGASLGACLACRRDSGGAGRLPATGRRRNTRRFTGRGAGAAEAQTQSWEELGAARTTLGEELRPGNWSRSGLAGAETGAGNSAHWASTQGQRLGNTGSSTGSSTGRHWVQHWEQHWGKRSVQH